MKEIARYTIPTKEEVRSLCWRGDELVDFASGIISYRLDGTSSERKWGGFGKQFNRCICSANGEYAVIYDLLGTKGLVFKGTELIREINRSYYCADVHGYPVSFINSSSGGVLLAHCPDKYCRLEIEDAETGERLTSRTSKSIDFFHSRLQASPDGKFLLSAGWIWNPIDWVMLFDVENALREPHLLDAKMDGQDAWVETGNPDFDYWEISSAAFNGSEQVVWIGGNGENDIKQIICAYDLTKKEMISCARLEECAGNLMPVGEFAVDFYNHPKLIELKTGKVTHRWDDLCSGSECGAIISQVQPSPYIALDPGNNRFAVVAGDIITVVQFG